MLAAFFLAASMLGAAPESGQIACLTGPEPAALSLSVLDLSTGQLQLVAADASPTPPTWSPDGSRIAYAANTADGRRIRVVSFPGGDTLEWDHALPINDTPRWTPDGARIVYSAREFEGEARAAVYTISREEEVLWGEPGRAAAAPEWLNPPAILALFNALRQFPLIPLSRLQGEASSGGLMLAVELAPSAGGLSANLAFVTETQTTPVPDVLVDGAGTYVEWAPRVHPMGQGFAFETNNGGDREIFVADFAHGLTNVSNHYEGDWNPVWHPQGAAIAFESFRSGRRGVYRVNPAAARINAAAVFEAGDAWAPAWSPDGAWIACVGDAAGSPDIYIASPDGDERHHLTDGPGIETYPAWRPAP